jgi:hypothetical protein
LSASNGSPAKRAFISYARDQMEAARSLKEQLEMLGLVVFLDMEIVGGESWAASLAKAIEQTDVVIALLSPTYFESRWAEAELALAFKFEKRIMPVMIEKCEVTGPLHHLQILNFTESNSYNNTLQLARAVAQIG